MQPNTGVKPWQWGVSIAVIVIIIGLGIYMWSGSSSSVPTDSQIDDMTIATSTLSTNPVNSVSLSDQFPGNIIYADSVRLANNGFLVIHKDNNGKPGDVIGSQYLTKGINPGKVTLTTTTINGKTYYAMLHADDGDKKFDATKDLPVKDTSGNVIMKSFKVTSDPVEDKG